MARKQAKERLYLSQDGQRVLPHGHDDAHSLLVHEGGEVPSEYADLVSAYEDEQAQAASKAASKSEDKAQSKSEDKSA
jgi:hypothetical protein